MKNGPARRLARTRTLGRGLSRGQVRGKGVASEADIALSASALMGEHGDTAWFAAARRAYSSLESGDMKAHREWLSVLHRIIDLEGVDRSGGMRELFSL